MKVQFIGKVLLSAVLLSIGTQAGKGDLAMAGSPEEYKGAEFSTFGIHPALSPDGKTVFVGKGQPDPSNDDLYRLSMYDVSTGSLLKEIDSPNSSAYYDFSPQGKYLISNGDYTNILNGDDGEQVSTLPFYYARYSFKKSNEDIAAFTYSSNRQLLDGNTVSIYDLSSGTEIFKKEYETDKPMRVALHPTEPIAAISCGLDIEVIDYQSKKTLKMIRNPFKLTTNQQYQAIGLLEYSNNGQLLTVYSNAGIDDSVKQFDALKNYSESLVESFDTEQRVRNSLPAQMENAVFSKDMKKVAYETTGDYTRHVVVGDYPIKTNASERIEFKDPYIQLREGSSTYYGLEYIDKYKNRILLEPKDVKLEALDPEILEINAANKIIAKKPGSTYVKATYKDFTDFLTVEVQSLASSRIVTDPLYDSSLTITGKAPENITLFGFYAGREYRITTGSDGSFTFLLDKPLKAGSRVWFMYYLEELYPAEAPPGSDYLFENVLRDTVAPAAPKITEVNQQTSEVQGITEPNAAISVSVDDTGSAGFVRASTQPTIKVSAKADKQGRFKMVIPNVKLSGRTFRTTAKDLVGNQSKTTVTRVADKIPPAVPRVKPQSNIATAITGTAEPYATIYVKKGTSVLASGKTSSSGAFSIKIPKQPAGTYLKISAMDAAKNMSKTVTIMVLKAPATPTVNSVYSTSTVVSGKSQAATTVYVKKGTVILASGKATSKGTYSIKITKQRKGTVLTIVAKNGQGVYSASKTITVK
ncbi:Ig-like domain-containing protein [Peribacillus sp. SCS-155]|uniref:Ig-like domain-containing protein n=1 Tax=Peribacillus sedimenti TaxID=3115297 RepID=UPI0039061CA1